MANEPKKGGRLLTPMFRVSFPQVWEKQSYNNGTPRFSVTGLFYPKTFTEKDKAKWQAIRSRLAEVCQEFFKKDLKTMKEDRTFKIPFHKGSEKSYEGYGDPDMIFFSMANSKRRPQILNINGDPITQENSEEFYAGCWARASVNPYAFNNIGKGLAIGLGNIQKIKDDESFEGFTSAEDDFGDDPVEGFDDTDLGGDDTDDLTA
jgi:Enterobacter phage Enc34, ssDNA-binding protein